MQTETQIKTERTKCPFYGFAYTNSMFVDSKGNQCALIIDAHSPCRMRIAGQEPDWQCCGANIERNRPYVEQLKDKATIFPEELKPEGATSWRGIPFRKWYERIMKS